MKTIIDVYEFIVEQNRRPELRDARTHTAGGPCRAPHTVYELITRCWAADASGRPSFGALLEQLEALRLSPEETTWLDAPDGHPVVHARRAHRGPGGSEEAEGGAGGACEHASSKRTRVGGADCEG